MASFSHFGQSFVGRRKNNQDRFCIHQLGEASYFLAVADGMGGTQGGEIASALCIDTSIQFLTAKFEQEIAIDELEDILQKLNYQCQEAIRQEIIKQPELRGMGTTLAIVLIHRGHFVCSNVGDSRIYLLEEGVIHQLSKDHTYIEDYAEEHGRNIPDQIIRQYSHYLTRCVDGSSHAPDIFPEKSFRTLREDCFFLLCSDGLILDKVYTNTHLIRNYIIGAANLEDAVHNLISHAFYGGSSDNITVVLFESGSYPRKELRLKQLPYPPTDEIDPYEIKASGREKEKTGLKKAGNKSSSERVKNKWKIHHIIELIIAVVLFLAALLFVLSHFNIIDLKELI